MRTDLWSEIARCLQDGHAISAATIVFQKGSSPGRPGAKALVGSDGLIAGTLGGGRAEAEAIETAMKTLADGSPRQIEVDMTGEAKAGADLICGGIIRIAVQRLEVEWLDVFRQLCERTRRGCESLLLTPLSGGVPSVLEPEEATPDWEAGENTAEASIVRYKNSDYILERTRVPVRLLLAGGGHVSLAVARMAELADFDITVMDDREEFSNPERFPFLAKERIHVVPEFHDCLTEAILGFPVTTLCSIVIVTRGHAFDGSVLAQSLRTQAGYIGMIGSTRKRDAVYASMRSMGFGEGDLERVHCPIGLPLGGRTPADIAVSIVAELVQARARRQSGTTL